MAPPAPGSSNGLHEPATFRTGPQWPWLIGSLIIFGLLLDNQIRWMGEEEMPVPVLASILMPTLAGWFIVGVPALYLLLFSVRTAVTVDPATKTLRTSTTMLLVLPIHSSRREFSDTRFVRIGLSGAVAESLGASAAGCLTGAVKMVVTFTLFGIWGYLFYRLMDDGSPEPPRGQPLAQIVFEDRDAWVIARGSESHVEERATLAARLIGVRLGG